MYLAMHKKSIVQIIAHQSGKHIANPIVLSAEKWV
jgi:hypothetical protein